MDESVCSVLMKLPVIYLVQVYFVCLTNKYKSCRYNRFIVSIINVYGNREVVEGHELSLECYGYMYIHETYPQWIYYVYIYRFMVRLNWSFDEKIFRKQSDFINLPWLRQKGGLIGNRGSLWKNPFMLKSFNRTSIRIITNITSTLETDINSNIKWCQKYIPNNYHQFILAFLWINTKKNGH